MSNRHIGQLILTASLLAVVGCASLPNGNIKATQAMVAEVAIALRTFELDCMRTPTEQEGLMALTENPGLKGWRGPYLRSETTLVDPWGNPLNYRSPAGKDFTVMSAGPDKLFGTRDDIKAE